MKLKPDCIRNILIYCENELKFGADLSWQPIPLKEFCESLPEYSREDIAYTLLLLDEAGFLDSHALKYDGGIADIYVYRLTYSGHEFLDTIKSDNVWKKLQNALSSIGSISLPVIQTLGSQYALELLKLL